MPISPVVVGVDDSAATRSAVLWAAHEAVLAGAPLLILHSPQLPSPGAPTWFSEAARRGSDDLGQAVLDASVALARANEPKVLVSGALSHADPAQALIAISAEARLLVLGSRAAVMGDMSMFSSKRAVVSAHSYCPVLLLGPISTFNPPRAVSRIVVGSDGTKAGRAALAFAAAEAVRRDVSLHLLRLVLPSSSAASPLDRNGSACQVDDELSAELTAVRREHPGLAVVADVALGEAAEILPSYSDGRTILVVGCHHSDDHWSTRLGPVATSVVHRNRGPVIVFGYHHDAPAHPKLVGPAQFASRHTSTAVASAGMAITAQI